MDHYSIARWLLDHGAPVIRYRIATEFAAALPALDLEALRADLLQDPIIINWLNNLESYAVLADKQRRGEGIGDRGNSSFLHGSTDMNIEVVLPKLAQLGLRAGMPILDEKTSSWLQFLETELKKIPDQIYSRDTQFLSIVYSYYDNRLIIASALAQAGYTQHKAVAHVVQSRLDGIYEAVTPGRFDIYEEKGKYSVHPKAWAEHLIKAELYADGDIRLPFIHDICDFALIYKNAGAEAKHKIDTIIDWILAPEHQTFLYNYGYIRCPDGRGKSVGHKMNFPGYFGFDTPGFDSRSLVFRCWQMAHFPQARAHFWFQDSLHHLEHFATAPGIYAFPPNYLPEASGNGYWIHGSRMGLGENRRDPLWRTVESTFWMFVIRMLSESKIG